MNALVAEATKKAAIIWVTPAPGRPPYPLWCAPLDGSLCVVIGGQEQPAPGLAVASTVSVIARGDHGGRIATWTARVEPIDPGSDAWATIAPALAGKRLNAEPTDELVAIWARTSTVIRLSPIDD